MDSNSTSAASFEDEMLSINPEYDIIYNKRDFKNRNVSPHALEPNVPRTPGQNMKIISKMNEIINAKPVGELAAHNDWDDLSSVEKETITLMRKLGLEQSVDRAPDESRTISTVPVNDDVIIMRNGRKKMSIFLADTYFELKPRSEPSFDMGSSSPEEESTTSVSSQDLNQYQPIIDSTFETETETETTSTSVSDESMEKKTHTTIGYRNMDSGDCLNSYQRQTTMEKFNCRYEQNGGKSHTQNRSRSRRSNESSGVKTKTSSSWRNSNGSFTDMRDENNWRKVITKNAEPIERRNHKEEVKQPNVKKGSNPEPVSNSGGPLYKPKELYMKRKAMLIQQVLADFQS